GTEQIRSVSGSEESLRPAKQTRIVLVPTHALSGLERLGDSWLCLDRGQSGFERSRQKDRAVLICQSKRLLRRQRVPPGRRIIAHIAPCRLRCQPLADITLRGARPLGQLTRSHRTGCQSLVQAELVSDHHHRGMKSSAKVVYECSQQLLELTLIETHL